MITMYLPTIDRPLWPCVVLLAFFIPISVWHEIHWRRTLAEYASARRAAGAPEADWPTTDVRRVLAVQPLLLLIVGVCLALMVALGAAALIAWPHRLPRFDEVLNYYDRPYLAAMLVAGIAAVVGTAALAVDLWRSPWQGVATHVRRAVHARSPWREAHLSAALLVDPEVPRR